MQMLSANSADIAIIGGGLAGLSLALHLQAQSEFIGRVDIFEPRASYKQDRHWSYFAAEDTIFNSLSAHRFEQFSIGKSSKLKVMNCKSMPYRVLRSEDVYQHASSVLNADSRFHLHLSSAVSGLEKVNDQVRLFFSDGNQSQSYKKVFDSRPRMDNLQARSIRFRQWFYGAEIRCSHTLRHPVLMDFDTAENDRLAFFYALPLSNDRLLVQYTCFLNEQQQAPSDAAQRWQRYINTHLTDKFEVLSYEHGDIPMQVIKPLIDHQQVTPIGAAAGWIRAATGYGFLDTQRACAELAKQIGGQLSDYTVLPRAHWDDRMDAIFLSVLERNPAEAANYFIDLFSADTDSVIRFLSGIANMRDRFKVMSALPAWPFATMMHRGLW